MIDIGEPAPPVSLPDQHGVTFDLGDFGGHPAVIYFYPRQHTRGCTTQACGIRDRWASFQDAGAGLVGVSADDVESHAGFAAEFDLPH